MIQSIDFLHFFHKKNIFSTESQIFEIILTSVFKNCRANYQRAKFTLNKKFGESPTDAAITDIPLEASIKYRRNIVMNNKITLRIHSVKCVDETGGTWAEKVGNDEINLSGFGIDSAANIIPVGSFRVYSHFDDGDIMKYSPPRKFVALSLAGGSAFPKTCTVGFLLAEIDGGDFASKLSQILNKLKEEIAKKKLQAAAVEPAGTGVDAPLPQVDVGTIWTPVKPIVFKFILDKVAGAVNDDVFPPKDVSVTIPSADFTFSGSRISPQFTVEFRGHNGVYQMRCDWELS